MRRRRQRPPPLGRARAAVLWERLWPALVPSLSVLGLFAALALSDLLSFLPGWLHALVLLAFAAALAYGVLRGWASFRPVSEAEARHRLELDNALEHRPLTALDDRLAAGADDAAAVALWRLHIQRMAEAARGLGVGLPSAGPGPPRSPRPQGFRGVAPGGRRGRRARRSVRSPDPRPGSPVRGGRRRTGERRGMDHAARLYPPGAAVPGPRHAAADGSAQASRRQRRAGPGGWPRFRPAAQGGRARRRLRGHRVGRRAGELPRRGGHRGGPPAGRRAGGPGTGGLAPGRGPGRSARGLIHDAAGGQRSWPSRDRVPGPRRLRPDRRGGGGPPRRRTRRDGRRGRTAARRFRSICPSASPGRRRPRAATSAT